MDVKKIIISRTDKIGDLVLSIPSFFMVKKMYPEAEITVLVRKYNYEIVKNLPCINRVIKIDDYRQTELLEKIKYFKADVFIALYNDVFVSKLAKASKAKWRIGPLSKLSSFFVFNKGVLQKRSRSIKNEAEYNLDLVKKLNPKKFSALFEVNTDINVSKEHERAVEVFLEENRIEGNLLVINPFMGGSAKNITDEQYAELISKLQKRDENINVVLACHISEENRGQSLLDKVDGRRKFLFANGGDLLNLASLIKVADVYLGGSTGPTHIAGSMKRKIIAIYPNKKTQHPTRWGVFGCDTVDYIIPDKDNKREKYKHKYFDSYTEEHKEEIVNLIIKRIGEK